MNELKTSLQPFENAKKLSEEYPDFYYPSPEDFEQISEFTHAKVCTGGERFWIEIQTASAKDKTTRGNY